MTKKKQSPAKAIQKAADLVAQATEQAKGKPNTLRITQETVEELISENTRLIQENEQLKGKVGIPVRHRLTDTRNGITHKFNVGGHEGYMTVGLFEDGKPGELFITMAKEGSTIGGLMDTIGTLTSIALQYGVNVETLARKFAHQRFEPSGFTHCPEIGTASSIIDYVFRWLELHFIKSRSLPVEKEATTPAA